MAVNNFDGPALRHEQRDVNARSVAKVGIALAVLIVATLFIVWFVFDILLAPGGGEDVAPGVRSDARRPPPEPRLQSAPIEDLRHMRAAEQRILDSYAWVDRTHGIARVPVSVAMELVARQGGFTK